MRRVAGRIIERETHLRADTERQLMAPAPSLAAEIQIGEARLADLEGAARCADGEARVDLPRA